MSYVNQYVNPTVQAGCWTNPSIKQLPYIPANWNVQTVYKNNRCFNGCPASAPIKYISNDIKWQPPLGEVSGLNFPQKPFPWPEDVKRFFQCKPNSKCTIYTHDKYLSQDKYNPYPSNVSY